MNKNYIYIAIALLVTGGAIVYFYLKNRYGKKIPLPNNGSGIPVGWSALATANELHALLNGIDWLNLNEDEIYTLIMALTNDQLAATYNEYRRVFGADLLQDLQDDLSGDKLSAVTQRFNTIL